MKLYESKGERKMLGTMTKSIFVVGEELVDDASKNWGKIIRAIPMYNESTKRTDMYYTVLGGKEYCIRDSF